MCYNSTNNQSAFTCFFASLVLLLTYRGNVHDAYPEEHRVYARGLFIQGLSISRIARGVNERFEGATITRETIERWRDAGEWVGMREGVQVEAVERQTAGIVERLMDQADFYQEVRNRAMAAIRSPSVGVKSLGEASSVLDTAIKGERQALQDAMKADFLKKVADIIAEEVVDEDAVRRIGLRFGQLLGMEVTVHE